MQKIIDNMPTYTCGIIFVINPVLGKQLNMQLVVYICISVFSPPGIAMLPAGLCFGDVTFFFNVAPLIRQRVDESQCRLLR